VLKLLDFFGNKLLLFLTLNKMIFFKIFFASKSQLIKLLKVSFQDMDFTFMEKGT